MSEIRLIDANKFLKDNSDIVEYDTTNPRYEDTVRELIDNTPTVLTIPDNPTNGQMLTAMYPDITFITQLIDPLGKEYIVFKLNRTEIQMSLDWWNTPYKGVEHENT